MNLHLDHFFILVEPEAKVADLLVELGMIEGQGNIHKGQGTSNRRFYFSNSMLEFLWVRDAQEATKGPAKNLFFQERSVDDTTSPFGVVLTRKNNNDLNMPFRGWQYQPEYFDPPYAFHIGENSNNFQEPLCIYVPFIQPGASNNRDVEGLFSAISNVCIYVPDEMSDVLKSLHDTDGLFFKVGSDHLMEITFNQNESSRSKDFRPDIPLVVHW